MFCKNCGASIDDWQKFCTKCGEPIVNEEPKKEEVKVDEQKVISFENEIVSSAEHPDFG